LAKGTLSGRNSSESAYFWLIIHNDISQLSLMGSKLDAVMTDRDDLHQCLESLPSSGPFRLY